MRIKIEVKSKTRKYKYWSAVSKLAKAVPEKSKILSLRFIVI